MGKVERLIEIVQEEADRLDNFFLTKGPGVGDRATNSFIKAINERTQIEFNKSYHEQRICGKSKRAVDYYFEDEETIVEIALGLEKPNSEFEKDILKAFLAQEAGYKIRRLVFIAKPGASIVCKQPGRQAFIDWAKKHQKLDIEVFEINNSK